jgi:hypothetical protein
VDDAGPGECVAPPESAIAGVRGRELVLRSGVPLAFHNDGAAFAGCSVPVTVMYVPWESSLAPSSCCNPGARRMRGASAGERPPPPHAQQTLCEADAGTRTPDPSLRGYALARKGRGHGRFWIGPTGHTSTRTASQSDCKLGERTHEIRPWEQSPMLRLSHD